MPFFKRKAFLVVFFALCQSASAELLVNMGLGYREDQLDWNISGPLGFPNILSELKWRDVQSIEASLEAVYCNSCHMYFRTNADIAGIFSGNNRDSDYQGNQRTLEFFRTYSKSNGDFAYDASAGIGYLFALLENRIAFAPLVGYSVHGQHLTMHDGELVISTVPEAALGKIEGLDSSYQTTWYGPWLGFDLSWEAGMGLRFWSSTEYHFARYHGTGNWNLRSDLLDDFTHDANGHGIVLKGGATYPITDCWELGIKGVFQTWHAEDGRDRIHALVEDDTDPQVSVFTPLTIDSKLNAVNWQSWSTSLFINYVF